MNIIELKHVFKHFPMGETKFSALKDINLNIQEGEFCGLIGPSGSGKTTLLNIIGTLDAPSEGEANLFGNDISQLSPKDAAKLRNHKIGFIFQSYNLLPVYSVFENIEFTLLLQGMKSSERKKAVMEALDWVGLADMANKKPDKLSGGESQRVAIARAMVKRPSIILADEPTANLDAENAHNILQIMKKLNEELNTSFIFSTHDEKVITYLNRQIALEDGKIKTDTTISNTVGL